MTGKCSSQMCVFIRFTHRSCNEIHSWKNSCSGKKSLCSNATIFRVHSAQWLFHTHAKQDLTSVSWFHLSESCRLGWHARRETRLHSPPQRQRGRVECVKDKMDGEWFHQLCSQWIIANLTFNFFKDVFFHYLCVGQSLGAASRLCSARPLKQGNKCK